MTSLASQLLSPMDQHKFVLIFMTERRASEWFKHERSPARRA